MPRIDAASIDEHVRRQTARITAAARDVFRAQGYRQTDLADIASEVGLARNSLYRYFPNKDHILLACIEEDMAPHLQWLQKLPSLVPDVPTRIAAWVDAQFELATGPAHVTMEFMSEVSGNAELRQRVTDLHSVPNSVLEKALQELPARRASAPLYAAMIGDMVLAATRQALCGPVSERSAIKQELIRAVACLLDN